ncbi:MAG: sugar fermentation stimulation protein SfsA, partial [Methanococcoides sp.]|nr:sugar fermentation stimulation protein SfsA [Methanococcoides sp.]
MVRNDLVMEIPWDVEATLLSRPNRFLGIVELDPSTFPSSNFTSSSGFIQEKVHIHDPGRLEDLLYPGNRLLLRKATNPKRKTGWDVIAAKADDGWILINSVFHRRIAEWAIANKVCSCFENVLEVIPEQKFGDSRL